MQEVTVYFSYALSMVSFTCPYCGEYTEVLDPVTPEEEYECEHCGKSIQFVSNSGSQWLPDEVMGESAEYRGFEDDDEEEDE